jgi:hypothetical protein
MGVMKWSQRGGKGLRFGGGGKTGSDGLKELGVVRHWEAFEDVWNVFGLLTIILPAYELSRSYSAKSDGTLHAMLTCTWTVDDIESPLS